MPWAGHSRSRRRAAAAERERRLLDRLTGHLRDGGGPITADPHAVAEVLVRDVVDRFLRVRGTAVSRNGRGGGFVEVLHERCAALDIGKKDPEACVRTPSPKGRRYERPEQPTNHGCGSALVVED